jgi:uncharacterized protein (TIGR02284 family)
MSTDKKTTKDLMEVLADGREGFQTGAEKLQETDSPEIATDFRRLAQQRDSFYTQLETMAAQYGDDVEETGSVAATLHRGWMSLKDAISGSSAKGVVDAAEQGEAHAVKVYRNALEDDISPDLRTVVQQQCTEIEEAHQMISSYKERLEAA